MSIPVVIYLYPENTQIVQLQGLQDVATGLYLNAATVTATLYDQRGNADPVLNGIMLSYIAGSEGSYQGTVPASFSPPAFTGQNPLGGYSLQVEANQGGVQSLFTIPAVIRLRTQ
jgi:hypothetical protein